MWVEVRRKCEHLSVSQIAYFLLILLFSGEYFNKISHQCLTYEKKCSV